MLCNDDSKSCPFNCTNSLKYISRKIRSCTRTTVSKYQFAATDAFIEHSELPYVPKDSFMASAQPAFHACVDDTIRSVSTLLAVVGSYPGTSDIVIFCNHDTDVSDVILSVDSVRSRSSWGVTYTIQSRYLASGITHTVTFGDKLHTMVVCNNVLQDVLQQVFNKNQTMSWHLPGSSFVHSSLIKCVPGHMWVNADSHRSEYEMVTRSVCSRTLPAFYSDASIGSLVSVNFGPEDYAMELSSINIQARVNTVKEYVLNATTKHSKCYYCSYLINLHDKVCPNVQNCDRPTHEFIFADGIIDTD